MKEWLKIFRMRLRDTVLFFSSLKLSLSHLSARRSSWTTGWPSQRPPRSPPTPPPAPSLPWSAPRLTSPIKAALGMGRARRRDQLKKNNNNVYCISNKTYCFYNLYSICILKNVLKFWFSTIYQIQPKYMTGLLHDVRGLIKPAIFGSLPWASVMCNWAEILICGRHWPRDKSVQRNWQFMVLGRIYGRSTLAHKFCQKMWITPICCW